MEALNIKSDVDTLIYILENITDISADKLARQLNTDKRGVRAIARQARLEEHLVGSNDNGYHLCVTEAQYLRFKAKELASIKSRQEPITAMDKTAKKLFGGQGDLFNG